MAGECGVILKVVEPIRSFMFDAVSEYVGYIGSCEDNLDALHKCLSHVCDRKDDINTKVKNGNDKQEEISREAASWLKDVWLLVEDEELKGLMYKDMETAKLVVKMMGKKDLKRRISQESEMQVLVVKVMKKLEEEMNKSEEENQEMRRIVEEYKQVAQVVVEVMKDTMEDFKTLLKEDKKMAVIATRTLKDRDLDKLMKGDKKMEKIIREAENASDEELWQNYEHQEESNALLVKTPQVGASKNTVKQAANNLFAPLTNLLMPLAKLMDDANFKKAVPEADAVKLGLDVIDGLLIKSCGLHKEMDGSTKQHRTCCCSSLSLCNHYHGRYQISKAAQFMTKHIQQELISKCPPDPVTLRIRTLDLKPVPTKFFKGLESRNKLLHRILEIINDDRVDVVGVFGMGGTGKTTLAKEVNKKVGDIFSIKVMVEVTDAPNIVRIQATIAESIDLPLHDVDNVAQRSIRLYNRLVSEKEKKILIILDNVWKKLNLDEIGIPCTCKLLLTTREREVCRVMDVQDVNTLEVGVINTDEAKELFKSQVGNQQVHTGEYKNVVERLLSKCGGLPLAIVATANSLKDKDLPSWKKFADDLEKPLSSQVTDDYRHTYSILDTSYKFIGVDEKRIFLLLACLSPIGSSVSIESLMRYGIGLNLFRHVNKLCEAMDQADQWANELMLSSMLLEGDFKGDIKVHDIVRAFAISFAAKDEGHKFLVESIPRWLDDEFLIKYTAMSLMSRNDYSRLSGVEACKLQILIVKGDMMSPNFDDFSFKGMVNLEVLSLSNMNFQPCLPESMRKLKKLRTLCMESCKLGDIKLVGELVNLLILSLRESFVQELTNEIGELSKLRLLDLSGCTCSKVPLIPACVLGKLSSLEGLYMFNKKDADFEAKFDDERTSAIENNRLPYLNALEIKVAEKEELPIDGQSIQNVDKFRVCVGDLDIDNETVRPFSRVLYFSRVDNLSGFLGKSVLNVLLKKADFLGMSGCNNFEYLVPQFDQDGFRHLRFLHLFNCQDIKYIVDGHGMNNLIAFPSLQSLELMNLQNLKLVCNGEAPLGTFSTLQSIDIWYLNELVYVLPLVPCNLTDVSVATCKLLNFVFIDNEETQVIELPFLKKLQLRDLPRIFSLVGPKMYPNSYEALQGRQIFFDKKIVLPSLELFELGRCHSVVKLWSKEIYTSGFQNLKDIKIERCEKLSSVGSPFVFSIIVQLETLSIKNCDEMREVITVEEPEESEIGEQIIRFPQLNYLELGCLSNLECFYKGGYKLEFPELKKLQLYVLGRMNRFAKPQNNSALFHEKIDFPCLEELQVRSVNGEVMGLWDMQAFSVMSNPAPMLRQLTLSRTAGLRQLPSEILENLSSLTLADFHDDNDGVVFASSDLGVNEGFVWTYSQLPNLEELKVECSSSLEELFVKEDCNGVDDASLKEFCGQVKTLQLNDLPKLKMMPLHLFKGLASLILCQLKWDYIISADALGDSLQQLQFLEIKQCNNMEALVIDAGLLIELPRLKQLRLFSLDNFKSFSSPSKREATLRLPSLESLDIRHCQYLEHFWSGSIVAPKLQDVALDSCHRLQQLFIGNPEDMIELLSLQQVSITWCSSIDSISPAPLTAPKLTKVRLWGCPSMQCFTPGKTNHNDDLQLSSLEIVDIQYFHNLHSFSLRRLIAPKLTQIEYRGRKYSLLQYDDLNDFLLQHKGQR